MSENVFYDAKDLEAIASIKRVLEYCNLCPGYMDRLKENPAECIKELGLDLTPFDISFYPNNHVEGEALTAIYPESKATLYAKFVNDKFAYLDVLKDRCTPVNESFKKWRQRQIGRSSMEIGAKFTGMVHAPFICELSDGCSVGCEFCGLGAGKLKSVFRYNKENAKLFNEVMQVVAEVIGVDAGAGTMYFATEPLDNPDYELFLDDYLKIFSYTPQITTAAATRNIERTHKLLEFLNKRNDVIYRFSLTSLEMFETVMKNFSKEELILVELLPQYDEAPGNNFVKTGRNAERMVGKEVENKSDIMLGNIAAGEAGSPFANLVEDECCDIAGNESGKIVDEKLSNIAGNEPGKIVDEKLSNIAGNESCKKSVGCKEPDEDDYADTICCLSGFKLNFCRKEVALITPTWASKEHPTGEIFLDKANFIDAEDLRQIMLGMISKHMMNIIGARDRIKLRPNISYHTNEEGDIIIESGRGTEIRLPYNKNILMYEIILDLCKDNYITRRDVVKYVLDRRDDFNDEINSETVFYILNRLWNMGMFVLESGKI